MSLLLCFFVLLLTFSTKDDAKLMDVVGLVKGALSPVQAPTNLKADQIATEAMEGNVSEKGEHRQRRVDPDSISPVTLRTYEFSSKRKKLEAQLKALGFERYVSLSLLDEGISLRIDLVAMFEPGTLHLRPDALQTLAGFAILCTGVDNEVRLTAKIPSTTVSNDKVFKKEWELSMARLAVLGDTLVNDFRIDQRRISYGTGVVENVEKGQIELLLVEKVGIKRISQEDLTKELMDQLNRSKMNH